MHGLLLARAAAPTIGTGAEGVAGAALGFLAEPIMPLVRAGLRSVPPAVAAAAAEAVAAAVAAAVPSRRRARVSP
jgi:hypothetical protein